MTLSQNRDFSVQRSIRTCFMGFVCLAAFACGENTKQNAVLSQSSLLNGGMYPDFTRHTVNLQSKANDKFLSVDEQNQRELRANRDRPSLWETFHIIDRNGGALESGDIVYIETLSGYMLQAKDGGGSGLNASSSNTEHWELFRIVKTHGNGRIEGGSTIGIQTYTRNSWVSVATGNGDLQAQSEASGSSAEFSIHFLDDKPWKLVWLDEFNGGKLDESMWSYEVKGPGWVNNELQNYTNRRPENARVEYGKLTIEARRDWFGGHEYSSARLKTQGKASWTYGRIEARIQVPAGWGTWPAFWMMPEDQSRGWPACGEIDVMEHVGHNRNTIHATTHSQKYNWKRPEQRTANRFLAQATEGFHIYALEWHPDRIEAFVDGDRYFTSKNDGSGDDAWPFHKNFHIIMNLAVGGDWGGAQGVDPNIWPQKMLVDWVRVYQK